MTTLELLDAEPAAAAPITQTQADLDTIAPAYRAAIAMAASQTRQDLAVLVEKAKAITIVNSPAGRSECHSRLMDLVDARVRVTKTGKTAREDATKFQKAIIDQEKALIAITQPEEDRLRTLRDEWDGKIAAEKAAKEQAERERLQALDAAITTIANTVVDMAGQPAAAILDAITRIEAEDVTLERFGDHAGRAMQAQQRTLAKLSDMHAAAVADEADRAAQAAERAQLAADRLAQEAAQQQINAQRAELEAMQAKLLADQKAAQDAIDLKARQQQEEQDRLDREAREAEARAEQARQQRAADVQHRIDSITTLPEHLDAANSATLAAALRALRETPLTSREFDDRLGDAMHAQEVTYDQVRKLHVEALKRERLQAEQQAEAARQQAEQAATAQREREAAEARAAAAARLIDNAQALFDALTGLLACPALDTDLDGDSAYMVENAEAVLAQVRGDVQPIAIPAEAAAIGAALDPASLEQGDHP